eukprot:g1583.t1
MPAPIMYPTWPLLMAVTIVPVVTFVATYTMSLLIHRDGEPLMEAPDYFLSSSIARKPASCVGTFGLSITCCALPILSFIRYEQIKEAAFQYYASAARDLERPLTNRPAVGLAREGVRVPSKIQKLNIWALKVIVAGAFGGLGVASFQSVEDDCGGTRGVKYAHFTFAFMFFFGGLAYAVLMWRLDSAIPSLGSPMQRFLRQIFAILAIIQFIALSVVLPLLTFTLHDLPHTPGIETMAVFEISLLGSFMSTFLTFLPDFQAVSFSLLVWHYKDRRYSLTERTISIEGVVDGFNSVVGGGGDGSPSDASTTSDTTRRLVDNIIISTASSKTGNTQDET